MTRLSVNIPVIRLSLMTIEEKMFQDAVKLMSVACPNSQCVASAVLESGCAAIKCTRCELAYCAACFYVMPPRALDGQHTGEPLSVSFSCSLWCAQIIVDDDYIY